MLSQFIIVSSLTYKLFKNAKSKGATREIKNEEIKQEIEKSMEHIKYKTNINKKFKSIKNMPF